MVASGNEITLRYPKTVTIGIGYIYGRTAMIRAISRAVSHYFRKEESRSVLSVTMAQATDTEVSVIAAIFIVQQRRRSWQARK